MIEVVKLPDALNVDERFKEKVLGVYGTCPYCGEDRLHHLEYYDFRLKRYGTGVSHWVVETDAKPIKGNSLFHKKYKWQRMKFHCAACGMEWLSPEYPVVGNDVDANNLIFHAWQSGQNMEINTLLLGVIKQK